MTLSGVIGYSYTLDQFEETTPDDYSEGPMREAGYTTLEDGEYYFHCRAVDDLWAWGESGPFPGADRIPILPGRRTLSV